MTGTWARVPDLPFWQLNVPQARDGGWVFHSWYVNGQSRTRARDPNHGEKPLRAAGREPGGDPRQALQYPPGEKPLVLANNVYHTLADETSLTFAGKRIEQWQAEGHDQGSVIGDPGCRDPGSFDFRIGPDAMACRTVGFEPFDGEIQKAGLYGEEAGRTLPEDCPPRTPTAV